MGQPYHCQVEKEEREIKKKTLIKIINWDTGREL